MMIFLWLACAADVQVFSFANEHNYSISIALQAESTPFTAKQDAYLRWDDLSSDILGADIESASIAKVALQNFANLSQQEVLDGLANESLLQRDLTHYAEYLPSDESGANLTEFSMSGTYVDPEEHLETSDGTFLASVLSTTGDPLMIAFFQPDAASSNDEISINSTSASISYDVDLQSSTKMQAKNAKRYVIEWEDVSESGVGGEVKSTQLDQLLMASFSIDIDEMEQGFHQLTDIADEVFELDVLGKTAVDMVEIDPDFTGFGDQTWLLALYCTGDDCYNPAPRFVGIIQP